MNTAENIESYAQRIYAANAKRDFALARRLESYLYEADRLEAMARVREIAAEARQANYGKR